MKSRGEFHSALKMFAMEIGVPLSLTLDTSGEKNSAKVTKMCHGVGTTQKILEESTQHAKLSERYAGLTKTSIRKYMRELDAPMVLWDLFAERRMCINNLTARPLFQLQVQNPHLSSTR